MRILQKFLAQLNPTEILGRSKPDGVNSLLKIISF